MKKLYGRLFKHNRGIELFVVFMTFIFAPLELYFSSRAEFWFKPGDFVPYLLLFAIFSLALWLLMDCIFEQLFDQIWQIVRYVIFLLFVAIYIQGTYLFADYGQLDGHEIDWSLYKIQGVISVAVYVGLLLIGIMLLFVFEKEKVVKSASIISAYIFLIQIVTLCIVIFNTRNAVVDTNYVVTSKNYSIYSKDENFIIVVLDAFDSRVLNDLYNGTERTRVEDVFTDFTFYKNTSNVMNNTELSIPQIITGVPFLNETTFWDYLDIAYKDSPLLTMLEDAGYMLNIYTNIHIPQGDIKHSIDNWANVNVSVSSHRRLLEYIYKVVGFRYLPQQLKRYCWIYSDNQFDLQDIEYPDGMEELSSFSWGNQTFSEKIDDIYSDSEHPTFHFFHIKGLHVPRDCDENFNPIIGDAGFEVTAKSVINMLEKYFDKLQDEDIYENSAIVILADHGANEYDGTYMKQTPVLLVKGKGEHHSFSIDSNPMSYAYLQRGYQKLLNCENEDPFGIKNNNDSRYMYIGNWQSSLLSQTGTGCRRFEEYLLPPDAYDTKEIVLIEQ